MNFATDYTTAYELLRAGGAIRHEVPPGTQRERDQILVGMADTYGKGRLYNIVKDGAVGRVKAAVYAFKLAKEMRRQKVLMNLLFDVKPKEDTRTIVKHPINFFPMTLNRTIVQMRNPEKE